MKNSLRFVCLLIFSLSIFSCENLRNCKEPSPAEFNADSAFSYIARQVAFSPRVPNTPAHDSCAVFLASKLKQFGAEVIEQKAVVKKFDGEQLHINNIIGQYNVRQKRRILLFSHWDSRFMADMDTLETLVSRAIAGANDGASGVGVLLEIARQLSKKSPQIGVDIIFFDGEDQGSALKGAVFDELEWSLGAQYWAKHLHKENYDAICGIGIDLVGDKEATFHQEDFSRFYNSLLCKQIWGIADHLGHTKYFIPEFNRPLYHDHVFVSKYTGIKSIMITDNKRSQKPFFEEWHTSRDNMSVIHKEPLHAVGQTVLTFIYCQE